MHIESIGPLYNSTHTILMVRPANFGSNPETLADNAFQENPQANNSVQPNNENQSDIIKKKGVEQFDNYVNILREAGVDVIVIQDTTSPIKPDAVFPNNWFTTHTDGTLILYPMKPVSRRPQRTNPVISALSKDYTIQKQHDLSSYQQKSIFLEGTGSMVFDHQNKIGYACISQRTHEELFFKVCNQILKYQPIFFQALDSNQKRYYHTNVVMSVASDFVIIGLDQVSSKYRQLIKTKILSSVGSVNLEGVRQKKEIIQLSEEQINSFCGNVLQVMNKKGQKILTMGQTAFASFRKDQLQIIQKYCKILKVPLPTIQSNGGGGSRCMMAEIFLPHKHESK